MITAAALVPHPPLLLARIGGGHDPLADLRSACVEAVRAVVLGVEEVVVVGGDDASARHDMAGGVDVRRFGTTAPRLATRGLPLSLGVGARLLDEAGWTGPRHGHTLAWDADTARVDALVDEVGARSARTGVVVLGDGPARLDPRGPGALDDRAFDLQETLAKALADGDATALAELDPVLAVELMVLGRAALGFLGTLALRQSAEPRATLLHREEPFGVGYLAATWLFG